MEGGGVTKVSVKPGLSVVQQNVKDGDEWLRGQVHTKSSHRQSIGAWKVIEGER